MCGKAMPFRPTRSYFCERLRLEQLGRGIASEVKRQLTEGRSLSAQPGGGAANSKLTTEFQSPDSTGERILAFSGGLE